MCFSAPASFLAGTILSATGIITLKQTRKKRQLPLALIPLLFGIQQLIEGFVWLSLGRSWPIINIIATYGFVMFSNVLWPLFVPLAVFLVETVGWRKKVIIICGIMGTLVSLYYFGTIIAYPITSQISCNSIQYIFQNTRPSSNIYLGFYLAATCLSCLLSSHRLIRIFGMSAVAFLIISYYYYASTLVSIWCFFAAILSLLIYLFFKKTRPN